MLPNQTFDNIAKFLEFLVQNDWLRLALFFLRVVGLRIAKLQFKPSSQCADGRYTGTVTARKWPGCRTARRRRSNNSGSMHLRRSIPLSSTDCVWSKMYDQMDEHYLKSANCQLKQVSLVCSMCWLLHLPTQPFSRPSELHGTVYSSPAWRHYCSMWRNVRNRRARANGADTGINWYVRMLLITLALTPH